MHLSYSFSLQTQCFPASTANAKICKTESDYKKGAFQTWCRNPEITINCDNNRNILVGNRGNVLYSTALDSCKCFSQMENGWQHLCVAAPVFSSLNYIYPFICWILPSKLLMTRFIELDYPYDNLQVV